jgi:hypothetical protein
MQSPSFFFLVKLFPPLRSCFMVFSPRGSVLWGCVHRFVTELWEGGDSGVVEGSGLVEVEMQATAVVLGRGGVGLEDVLESEEEREA